MSSCSVPGRLAVPARQGPSGCAVRARPGPSCPGPAAGAAAAGHARIGYARASTGRQSLDAQADSLKASGVTEVFAEKVSPAHEGNDGAERDLAGPGRAVVAVARQAAANAGWAGPAGSQPDRASAWIRR